MSVKVKARLSECGLECDRGERVALDLVLEARYGVYCDDAVGRATEAEFRELVKMVKERERARRAREAAGMDADAEERALVEAAYQ